MAQIQTSIVTLTLVEFIAPSRNNKDRTLKKDILFTKQGEGGHAWCAWVPGGSKLDHMEKFPEDFKIHYTKTLEDGGGDGGNAGLEDRIDKLEKTVIGLQLKVGKLSK